MTSIDGRLPGLVLVVAGLAISVAVFTPWAVIGYRDERDREVLLPPPGWYPHGPDVHYWDGRAWTGHVRAR